MGDVVLSLSRKWSEMRLKESLWDRRTIIAGQTYGLKETLDSGHVANLNETVLLTSLRSGEGPGRQVAAVTTAGTVIRDVRH